MIYGKAAAACTSESSTDSQARAAMSVRLGIDIDGMAHSSWPHYHAQIEPP